MKKYRLLCVDDQEGIRLLIKEIFKDEYEVVTVETGSEAIKLVKDFKPDIVVLDIKLKDINGGEVLKSIKTINKNINVVILTGYEDISQNTIINEVKPDLVVHKPFDVFSLKEKLNLLIANSIALAAI